MHKDIPQLTVWAAAAVIVTFSFQRDRKDQTPRFQLFCFDSFFCLDYQFFASHSLSEICTAASTKGP